ncbi:MAG: cytochrome c biogenesis protein CcsA [Acidimicrobiales bacterium]|nr:cytochrome c biogenesis protein CcsA [Acidimicrobiales bacterium]MCB9394071.1 cytochrome c biogenesis protein CcsA [Acidimicrobiaceae bacterium]
MVWAAIVAAATLRLWWAFVRTDLRFAYVASHTWVGERWWYRAVGLWSGMEGSLLLFATLLAIATAVAVWPGSGSGTRAARWAATAASVGVGVVASTMAWPFERLAVPAVQGFGIEPILRHPAMIVHPPLLYLGVVTTVVAFVRPTRARGPLLVSSAVLVAAMTLGGWWSYAEQGWGGYWGWDPVENTSLVVWLVVLAALHSSRFAAATRAAIVQAPLVVTLFAAALARSGRGASVHSFAASTSIGVALACVALVPAAVAGRTLVVAVRSARRSRRAEPHAVWAATAAMLAGAAALVLAVLTAAPALARRDGARLGGSYHVRPMAAIALVAAVALATMLVRSRGSAPRWAWVSHAGFVVLLVGAAGSSFDRAERRWLVIDEPASVAGVDVRLAGVSVAEGATPGSVAVTATLDVAGETRRPALVTHPERGGTLPETAQVSRPWRDVQLVVLSAEDDRALVEVRAKPLVSLVWLGAVLMTLGAAVGRAVTRSRRQGSVSASPGASFASPD